ncbi:MAG TPA: helix-turn-helix domain-containing protein [Stellaceae bacterium]|nr:helix-turn-helix domain-containing protein [Stellaceae bacterium]
MSEPGRRVRRTPEEARRLILDTAEALIARTGPEGLRLQDIAAAAGISHPLILHHFGSRAGLVRALTQRAAEELKDRLLATMTQPEYSAGEGIERVFETFRGGLAQRLAWLAIEHRDRPGGKPSAPGRTPPATADAEAETASILRQIADVLHARRVAAALPGQAPPREDTVWLIHLVASVAFGDAIYGAELRRSAGVADEEDGARRFRHWLAALLRDYGDGG